MSEDPHKFKADDKCYRYYAMLETWTREEAAALLLKLDPRKALVPDGISHMRPADYWQPYADLLEMLKRARTALPDHLRLKPQLIVNWAKLVGLNPPQQLTDAIAATRQIATGGETYLEIDDMPNPHSQQIEGSSTDSDELHHKTKASLLKLIAGMAIRGYVYSPLQKQNKAISDIESDLRLLNIPLSDDTIRRWVSQACELIDWETVGEDAKPRNPK